ncbi:hypothetical protein BDR04DRAFT_1152198 [Suillus decipiens]|nr:hypothetical protein BDR04DRAFT_1152198 [Suillus decipiens]
MSSWPHIHTLEIFDSGLCSSPVTFRALFTALRLRPQLRSLQVPINTVDLHINTDSKPIQHSPLENLRFMRSKILAAHPEAVARTIFTWFPCIDRISGYSADLYDGTHWKEVNRHLISLKAAAPHATGAASST